ncbi:hypothetical protein [Luteolibacter arcticus]|nr:hypothetical protein [Luteolibacter arcticus]
MRPDLTAAIADMEAKADEESTAGMTPAALGWRHAAQIVRLFSDPARALRQFRQHAGFFTTSAPEKAQVYRAAAAVLTHHTGEHLAAIVVRESYDQSNLELVLS